MVLLIIFISYFGTQMTNERRRYARVKIMLEIKKQLSSELFTSRGSVYRAIKRFREVQNSLL